MKISQFRWAHGQKKAVFDGPWKLITWFKGRFYTTSSGRRVITNQQALLRNIPVPPETASVLGLAEHTNWQDNQKNSKYHWSYFVFPQSGSMVFSKLLLISWLGTLRRYGSKGWVRQNNVMSLQGKGISEAVFGSDRPFFKDFTLLWFLLSYEKEIQQNFRKPSWKYSMCINLF